MDEASDSRIVTLGQYLHEEVGKHRPRFYRAVRPLFAADDHGDPDLVASCTLLRIGDTPFLVTAAHVRRRHFMDSSAYVGGSKMVEITADGFESDPINGVDKLDFLVARLDAATEHALGDVDFVPLSDIDTRGSNAPGKVECMLGYPVSRHKRAKMYNRARRRVRLDPMQYGAALDPAFDPRQVGASPSTHLVVRFEPENTRHPGGVGTITAPSPYGMSGGGLWYFPNLLTSDRAFLSGLLIEWHENYDIILAVKMSYVVERIVAWYPEVGRALED